MQKVYGIGLATGLPGTGSAPIESGQRDHLQRELQLTNDIDTVKELLADKNTELVIIEGRYRRAHELATGSICKW